MAVVTVAADMVTSEVLSGKKLLYKEEGFMLPISLQIVSDLKSLNAFLSLQDCSPALFMSIAL